VAAPPDSVLRHPSGLGFRVPCVGALRGVRQVPAGPPIKDDDLLSIDWAFRSPKREVSVPVPVLQAKGVEGAVAAEPVRGAAGWLAGWGGGAGVGGYGEGREVVFLSYCCHAAAVLLVERAAVCVGPLYVWGWSWGVCVCGRGAGSAQPPPLPFAPLKLRR
jgi:hypothetical protein